MVQWLKAKEGEEAADEYTFSVDSKGKNWSFRHKKEDYEYKGTLIV
jgi:hypothetical protein